MGIAEAKETFLHNFLVEHKASFDGSKKERKHKFMHFSTILKVFCSEATFIGTPRDLYVGNAASQLFIHRERPILK